MRRITSIALLPLIFSFLGAPAILAHEGENVATIEISMGELYFQVKGKVKNAPITLEADREYFLRFVNEGFADHEAHFGKNPQRGKTGLYAYYAEELMPGFRGLHLKPKEIAVLHVKIPKDKVGEWELGCFMPGHYEGGQKAIVHVVSPKTHH